jgi:surfeit locus 1 family protein
MKMRIPILPTIIVLAAVAVMVGLGVWQLGRADWKTALIARYEKALTTPGNVAFPSGATQQEAALYRHSSVDCIQATNISAIAGRSLQGEQGWAHTASCKTGAGEVEVALGWSQNPEPTQWAGGSVSGWIAPAGKTVRLVAEPAQGGLQQLARPDPRDLPNNHLAYAVQWFFFALTALVIYALALRKRLRG